MPQNHIVIGLPGRRPQMAAALIGGIYTRVIDVQDDSSSIYDAQGQLRSLHTGKLLLYWGGIITVLTSESRLKYSTSSAEKSIVFFVKTSLSQ